MSTKRTTTKGSRRARSRAKLSLEKKEPQRNSIPAAFETKQRTTRQPHVSTKGEITTVKHTAYVADVNNSTDFQLSNITVNPGLEVFPWLSSVAQAFEHYRLIKCDFHYSPVVGTTTSGIIGMAPDYNMDEPLPGDFKDMMAAKGSTRGQTFVKQRIVIDAKTCHAITPWKYVRHQDYSVNERSVYDACSLLYATQHGANTSMIGELYATYIFEFKTPQVQRPVVPSPDLYVTPVKAARQSHNLGDTTPVSFPTAAINTLLKSTAITSDSFMLDPGTYDVSASLGVESAIEQDVDGIESFTAQLMVDGAPYGGASAGVASEANVVGGSGAELRNHRIDLNETLFLNAPAAIQIALESALTGGGISTVTSWDVLRRSYLKLMKLNDARSRRT